jgi:alkaline phosphatase
VGNHEFKQTKVAGYHEYWGDRGGPFDRYCYDVESWHVVVLNSECHRVGCEFGSSDGDQVEWLEADLEASDARCTIAIWHTPRWSSGRYSNDPEYDTLWRVLYDHGAEVVLKGTRAPL